MIWIAPPLGVRRWLYLFAGNTHLELARKRPKMPQLMIMGSEDNFTSVKDFEAVANTMPEAVSASVLKGIDHFFGSSAKLKNLLAEICKCIYCANSTINSSQHSKPNDSFYYYLHLFLTFYLSRQNSTMAGGGLSATEW